MTREDFQEWKTNPLTEAWLKSLGREELPSVLAREYVDLSSMEKTAMNAAYRAGIIEGITRSINFVPEGAQT